MRTIWVKIETPDYDDEEPRLLEQDIKQELCACWHYWGKENISVFVDADYVPLMRCKDNTPLYLCDPNKNTVCRKTGCYINGGECYATTNKDFKLREV